MKLYYSQTSPFARKVRLAAEHLGLTDRIELVAAVTTPVAEDAALAAATPLGKLPALVLDDGTVLFDSRVIVEYLDQLAGGGGLIPPASDPARWRSLRIQATADGLLDAAVLARYEVALRPEAFRWSDWTQAQTRKVTRAVAALEADAAGLATGPALDAIATACALGYLDFRFAELDWRAKAPGLAAFYAAFSKKPEMAWTDPTAG